MAFTKNNWPADWLTWWGFRDSWCFPSVRAALLAYPVHCRRLVYHSSSFVVFEIRTVRWPRRSRRCAVWKAACSTRTTRESNCYESDEALRVGCQLAMLPFSLPLWSCDFFLLKAMSIKPWTIWELGLSSQKTRTFRRNLLGPDHETWSRWRFTKTWAKSSLHACLHGPRTTAGQRWFELPGHRQSQGQHLGKDASDGWFLTVYVWLLESSYKSARKVEK